MRPGHGVLRPGGDQAAADEPGHGRPLSEAVSEAARAIVEQSAGLVQDRILELRETAVTGTRGERAAAASELERIRDQVARMERGGVTAQDVLGMLGVVPAEQRAGRVVPPPGRSDGPRRPARGQGGGRGPRHI